MKKILMICLALVMGLGMCAAAGKPAQKKEVTTVFVTDIDCEHCVKTIMNNVPSLGKGISGMHKRARALHATLTVRSRTDGARHGTTVTLRVPLPHAADSA